MPRILLVKTSSLGDVVHNLPVVNDIRRHVPDAIVDWVVEEPFAPIPDMHPGVTRVIHVAVRRWRRAVLAANTREEFAEYRHLVGQEQHDAVIDTQGLIKSALLARAAALAPESDAKPAGGRHGFDSASAREPLAARFYTHRHTVARGLHAVTRNRLLVAEALGYRLDLDSTDNSVTELGDVDYGIKAPVLPEALAAVIPRGPYAVLLHGTSRADKNWPENKWVALGKKLAAQGIASVLPWGHREDEALSRRIAAKLSDAASFPAIVPPHVPVDAVAALLAGAQAVVGVDTGLMHLAVALGRPVVAIFTGTDPAATGAFGSHRAMNIGGPGKVPKADTVHAALLKLMAAK